MNVGSDIFVTPGMKIQSCRINIRCAKEDNFKFNDAEKQDFFIQDVCGLAEKCQIHKDIDITYIININYTRNENNVGMPDDPLARMNFNAFLEANKNAVIIARVGLPNNEKDTIESRESIRNLCIFLEENGFVSANSFCHFEYSLPYIYRNNNSIEIIREIIRQDILPENMNV